LLVSLDGAEVTFDRQVRVLTGVAACASLAQEVPQLVELLLEGAQTGVVVVA
jgi:hypothetical protein